MFLIILTAFFLLQNVLFAQGSLDNSFGTDGKVTTNITPCFDEYPSTVLIQEDGKIIISGYAYNGTNSSSNFNLIRYDKDGKLDKSFGFSGKMSTDLNNSQDIGLAAALQKNGKIIVAGYSYPISGTFNEDFAVARYKADGTLDNSFGNNGKKLVDFGSSVDYAACVAIQQDGKIVLGGYASDGGGNTGFALARFDSSGNLDPTFDLDGKVIKNFGSQISALKIDNSGKIVAAGYYYNGLRNVFAVLRFNSDGSLDGTFGTGGISFADFGNHANPTSIALVPDGINYKIIVAGTYFGTNPDFALAQFNSDGSLDLNFGSNGLMKTDFGGTNDYGNSVIVQNSGKIIIAGNSTLSGNNVIGLARYNKDGTPDNSFGSSGIETINLVNSFAYSAALQPDQNGGDNLILAARVSSPSTSYDFAAVKLDSNGVLDNSFGNNGVTSTDLGSSLDIADATALQTDGKIIAAGYTYVSDHYNLALVRYNTDGSLDTSFNHNGIVRTDAGSTTQGKAVAVVDNKIFVAGNFNNGSDNDFLLDKFNSDGSIDNSFQTTGTVTTNVTGGNDYVSSMAIQENKKMVVGGYSAGTGGNDFTLVRYNIDGSLDLSFNSTGVVITDFNNSNDGINSVAIQPSDQKIIAAGFSTGGANTDFAISRYNTDGSLDNSFGSNGKVVLDFQSSNDNCNSVLIQTDKKIIGVGYSLLSSNYSGVIARFNQDGSIDNSFGTNGKVITSLTENVLYYSASLQGDGKIIAAGVIQDSTGTDFLLARYNSNGTLDNTFGNNGIVRTDFSKSYDAALYSQIQTDGKIVAAGYTFDNFSDDFALLRYNALYPISQISSASIQFGNVFIDSSSVKSFYIKNTGSAALNIDSIISSNNVFKASKNNLTVAPGDSQKIDITFKPVQAQSYNAKLLVYHNASGSPDTLELNGTGKGNSNAVISLSVNTLEFGMVTVNSSLQKTMVVKNTGTTSLSVDSIVSNKNVFTINKKTFTVAPGDSEVVTVTFTPGDTIIFSGKLTIYHNAPGSPSIITLSGTGTSKPIPIIDLSANTVDFGLVTINKSLQKNLIVRNTGTADLIVDSISISNKNLFSVDAGNFQVSPKDSHEVKITFTPNDTLTHNASLKIFYNSSSSSNPVTLTGKGTSQKIAIIEFSRTTINFGDLTINTSSQQIVNISNSGSADLKIDSIKSNNIVFKAAPVNFILKPDSSKEVTITFTPADSVTYNSSLDVYNSTSASPNKIVVNGTGVSITKPIIKISSTLLTFGNVIKDSSKTLKLNIENPGSVNLVIDSIKSTSTSFVINPINFIVKPDSSKDISVTFTPKDIAVYNDVMTIFHNATGKLTNINLSGTGVAELKPEINLSAASLAFGDIAKGSSSTLNFNIKNTGQADLKVDSIKSDKNVFSASPASFSLKPDSSKLISVLFTPQDSISYNGNLNIYHNAAGSPGSLTLSGMGFIYPTIIPLNQSISFGDVNNINNYKILGIPGNSNIAVSTLMQGDYQFDWNVYDDNGDTSNYLVSNTGLKFTPGKGYWILSTKPITINQQLPPVQLDGTNNTFSIPLHPGWNLIANPFEKNITWLNVQQLNGLPANSLIYSWNGTSWENPFFMVPYEGYYFNNTGNLTSLKLHYEPRQPAGKISADKNLIDDKNFVKLFIEDKNQNRISSIFVGIDSLSKDGIDNYDYYSPPTDFQKADIRIVRNELPAREKYLFIEQRPAIKNGQTFNIEIKTVPDKEITLGFEGTDNFKSFNIYLLDERLKNLYNLRESKNIKLNLAHQYNKFKLLIGTDSYVDEIKQKLNISSYQLYQNYPNPFNPTTIIRFSIPKEQNVSLKVYNILGQIVKTLADNQIYDIGTHELVFDGRNLASGVYILSLETANFNTQKKMMLIK